MIVFEGVFEPKKFYLNLNTWLDGIQWNTLPDAGAWMDRLRNSIEQ